MNIDTTSKEYCDVIRVNPGTHVYAGYKYIAWDERYTLATLQYAREMTLARGRILYEVWDFYQNLFLGYIVPHHIFNEALANRNGASLAAWSAFPTHQSAAHNHINTLIIDRFPGIPRLAAKIISESMHLKGYGISLNSVDDAVVEHAQYCWTSYEFRLGAGSGGKDEAFEAVKARMREVSTAWLPDLVDFRVLASFWRKYGLMDECQGPKGDISSADHDLFYSTSAVQWFGGAEVPGNLISETHLKM